MIFRPDARHFFAALALVLAAAPIQAVPDAGALQDARVALGKGDGIAAELHAKQALESGVPEADVAALIGKAELLQDNLPEARNWLEGREFSADNAFLGFHSLAQLELREGDLAAAARAFDRALALEPDNAVLWTDIGTMRYRAGEHVLAIEAAEKAVALGPEEPASLLFRGLLLRDAVGPAASLPWFEQALEAVPDDVELMGEYAASLGELGRNREMLVVVRQMAGLDPTHPRIFFLQSVLAARAGQTDLARRLLQRMNGTYGDMPAGMMLAGVLEFRSGNSGAAVDIFDALLRRQPDNHLAAELLGRVLLASGEANELVSRFAERADSPNTSPYLLALVGRAYERLGQRDMAATYLDRAVQARTSSINVLPVSDGVSAPLLRYPERAERVDDAIQAARILLAERRENEALVLMSAMRERFPQSADVALLAGDVALYSGRANDALGHYGFSGRIRLSWPLVLRMATALNALDRQDEAAQLLSAYREQRPLDRRLAAIAVSQGSTPH